MSECISQCKNGWAGIHHPAGLLATKVLNTSTGVTNRCLSNAYSCQQLLSSDLTMKDVFSSVMKHAFTTKVK